MLRQLLWILCWMITIQKENSLYYNRFHGAEEIQCKQCLGKQCDFFLLSRNTFFKSYKEIRTPEYFWLIYTMLHILRKAMKNTSQN